MPDAPDEVAVRKVTTIQAGWRSARGESGLLTRAGRALAFMAVLCFAAIFIMPLYWMVATALKTLPEVFLSPPTWWPAVPQWHNIPDALKMFPFWRYAGNTVQITVPVTVGTTVSSAVVAYSFARLRWPGRDLIFYLVLAT
jgi:multiple sugar transport system permease protein